MEKREGWEGGRQIEDEVEVYGWRDDRGGGKGRMNGMGRLRKRWRCMDGQRQGRRKRQNEWDGQTEEEMEVYGWRETGEEEKAE